MLEPGWPLTMLAIRLLIVVGLYGFVLITVRALRSELRARTIPAVAPSAAAALPVRVPQRRMSAASREAVLYAPIEPEPLTADLETPSLPASGTPEPARRTRPRPARTTQPVAPRSQPPRAVLVALAAVGALMVIGGSVFALRSMPSSSGSPTPSAQQALATPAPGHVTVSLLAHEDSSVRVTVDGTVQFDGVMRPNERRSWDGKSGIDVWTDKGKTLELAVDGKNLGPYSPAMNHPDWNRIDFSFWPGYTQAAR